MKKAIQWKITIILLVIAVCAWLLYPSYRWFSMSEERRQELQQASDPILERTLSLGLDLQGGMHLILEVDLDEVPEDMEVAEAMNRALEIVRNRVDQFGVAEPLIARQGDRWIVVQLPGLTEPERAVDLIGQTALLEFRLVSEQTVPSDEADAPEGTEILEDREGRRYLVKKEAELTGASLRDASVQMAGEFGQPAVGFNFERDAAASFEQLTADNIDRRLAIVLDGVVQSAPNIRERIPGGEGIIQGGFSMDTARDLAIILRAGALPAPVEIIENRTVGPTLGRDSIRAGITAMFIGFALVLLFMPLYYRSAGFVADIALLLDIFILLGAMAYFQFTLTLPGLAGIILIIGMAVDANVLIFERIRE